MGLNVTCDNCNEDFYDVKQLPEQTDCSECGQEMCPKCIQKICLICKETLCESCIDDHEENHKEEEGEEDE